MEKDFREICQDMGGAYIESNGQVCIIWSRNFKGIPKTKEYPGVDIVDSSLRSGGKMNIENIENVREIINYNYYNPD